MIRTFDTPEPVDLFVEIHNGDITVRASDSQTTTVEVVGDETDIRVEHDGSAVRVIGPKVSGLGFFRRTVGATIRATVPATSSAVIRTASADCTLAGDLRSIDVRSASGDIVTTGRPGALTLLSGSGDLSIEAYTVSLSATTGSGDVTIASADQPCQVKAGSGDVLVHGSAADLDVGTGSGDVTLASVAGGRVRVRAGSGDLRVAVQDGIPVWTQVSALGDVTNRLTPRGTPQDGQGHVELRAQVGSGDVTLADAPRGDRA